jgi:hypothetical protein
MRINGIILKPNKLYVISKTSINHIMNIVNSGVLV